MLTVNVVNGVGWAAVLFGRVASGVDSQMISGFASALGATLATIGLVLSYSRYGKLSGWMLVATSMVSTTIGSLSIEPYRAEMSLYFLCAPVAIAALMISSRAGIGTFLAAAVAHVGVTWARQDLNWEGTLPSGGFMVYLAAILIVATYVKERLERDHKTKLAEASKMASLGQMSAGIAHEINNPLFVLSVSASRLADLVLEPELNREQLIDISHKVADMTVRIEHIAKGLKNFAREASADPFHEALVREILNETRELCRHRFAQEKVQLTVLEAPSSLACSCRPVQISQVLVNLLNNAIDAVQGASEKWVRIETEDHGTHVSIAVVDSGPGIPAEHRKRIMNPFFTTKSEGKGTGLGLSLSLAIARDHGGRLCLDAGASNTRFVLELPKMPPNHPQMPARAGDH